MSMPELGSKISLISKADIRYEGKLFTVDPQECTIALSHVQSFGTEDRPTEFKVPAQSQIYNYILFRGSDIKDIKVITPQIPLNDPAIVQLSVPPNLGGFNTNYQPIDELGSANAVGNSYNPMSGVNLNAGPSHNKQASESPLILDPQPVIQQKQLMTAQSDVLDLISGGASRSSTPAQSNAFNGQQKSPTFEQATSVANQQSPGNVRGGKSHRNRSTSSTSDTRKQVRQQGQNFQRNDQQQQQQHYQRNDHQHYQRNDFQQHDNSFANRQGGNRNINGRNWNNQNNQQQQQQQVRRQNTVPNVTGGGRSFYNRSTGLPAPSKAQGPRSNSLKFDEDYDFDKANSEFQEIIKKLSRTKLDDGLDNSTEEVPLVNGGNLSINGDSMIHANSGEQVSSKKTICVDSGNENGGVENENEGDEDQKVFYDKAKSFFDTISCEAVERSKGHSQRTDWRTERKLNSETFGVAMAKRGQYHRGRGGYYHNNNSNYRPNPNAYNNGNYNNNRQGMNYNYRQQNNGYMRNNPNNRGYNYRPRPTNKQDQRQPNAVSPQRVAVA